MSVPELIPDYSPLDYAAKGYVVGTDGTEYPIFAVKGMTPLKENGKDGYFHFIIEVEKTAGTLSDVEFRYDYVKGDYSPTSAKEAALAARAAIHAEWKAYRPF